MAVALREAFALVTCPICARQVESAFINAHIDSGCQKHGRKPQQQQPSPGSARRRPAEEDEGASPPPAKQPRPVAAAPAAAQAPWEVFGSRGPRQTPADAAARAHCQRSLRVDSLLSAHKGARVWGLTEGGESWVLMVPRWARMPTAAAFDDLWRRHPEEQATVVLFGEEQKCARWTQIFGRDYDFAGQTARSGGPLTAAACGEELIACYQRVCGLFQPSGAAGGVGLRPNGVLINWYDGGQHYIGAHSDDESQLVPGAPIVSVSWGARRRFRLLPKRPKPPKAAAAAAKQRREKLEVELGDGDLLIMGGSCQKTHKHEVPKTARMVGKRINATFRCFRAAEPPASSG